MAENPSNFKWEITCNKWNFPTIIEYQSVPQTQAGLFMVSQVVGPLLSLYFRQIPPSKMVQFQLNRVLVHFHLQN